MKEASIDLVKNVALNYKDIMSWFLLVVIIIIEIVRYKQNVKLAKTVESYKFDLSKSEIKFTRHTELQIECLKKQYDLLVTFHFSYSSLVKLGDKQHHWFKLKMKEFRDDFSDTLTFSHRNRILLPDEITAQLRIIHEKFKGIEDLLDAEAKSLGDLEDAHSTYNPQEIYRTEQNEIAYISGRIEKLNQEEDIRTFEVDLELLRKLIEDYFKKLVS